MRHHSDPNYFEFPIPDDCTCEGWLCPACKRVIAEDTLKQEEERQAIQEGRY
jgi:hypothetical protein